MQLPAGGRSTPAHEHGREEELFYVLAGSGLVWQAGRTAPIGAGDGILFAPGGGAHTIRADDGLDLLAFGTRKSDAAGLQHVDVAAGMESTAQHCHSAEEEIFVILDGDGFLLLGEDETPVGSGHVIVRPPGTGVGHVLRAGPHGLTYLAYGNRDPSDLCYYPRSNKIAFRGVHLIAGLEKLEYWDDED